MTDSHAESPPALGFLTVVDSAPHGLIGGYLILNAHARPLEFHCTVPIRANRAQEILYGPTLEPYLYGEQIAGTLVKTSTLQPLAVFTDCPAALAAAAHVDPPLWLVMPPLGDEGDVNRLEENAITVTPSKSAMDVGNIAPPIRRTDDAHRMSVGMSLTRLGRNNLARPLAGTLLHTGRETTQSGLSEQLTEIATSLDLSEPFERIRAAIQEAQRGNR
ncbi:MAG TPA: hypothetical protein VGG64_26545 [Pirellulales bacterium]|jgi:hypothetical protein